MNKLLIILFLCGVVNCYGINLEYEFNKQRQLEVKVRTVCLASFFSFSSKTTQTILCTPNENKFGWEFSVIDKTSSQQASSLVASPDPDKLLIASNKFIYIINKNDFKIIDKISPRLPECTKSIGSFLGIAKDEVYISVNKSSKNNRTWIYKGKFPLFKNNFVLEKSYKVYPWADDVIYEWKGISTPCRYLFFSNGRIHAVPTKNFDIDLNKQMTYDEFKRLRKLKNRINRSNINKIDFDNRYGWLISRNGLDDQTGMRHEEIYQIKPLSSGYSVIGDGYNAFWGPAGEIYFFKEKRLIVRNKNGKAIPVYNFTKSPNNNIKPVFSSDRRFLAILSSDAELMIFDLKNKLYTTKSLPREIIRIGNTNGLFHITNVCGVYY